MGSGLQDCRTEIYSQYFQIFRIVFSFLPPTIMVMFTSALADMQQQNAHFPLETHTLAPQK